MTTSPELTAEEIAAGTVLLKQWLDANVSAFKRSFLGNEDATIKACVTLVVGAVDRVRDSKENPS